MLTQNQYFFTSLDTKRKSTVKGTKNALWEIKPVEDYTLDLKESVETRCYSCITFVEKNTCTLVREKNQFVLFVSIPLLSHSSLMKVIECIPQNV